MKEASGYEKRSFPLPRVFMQDKPSTLIEQLIKETMVEIFLSYRPLSFFHPSLT